MRLKNIKGASEKILEGKYFISNPKDYRGKWNKLFNNNNPIYIEIGMGKGNFIIKNAIANPNINYIGIEMYDSVILRAVEKTNELELNNLYLIRMDARLIEEVFDKEIDLRKINIQDIRDLKLLEPYGEANKMPLFLIKNMKIQSIRTLSEGKHIKLKLGIDNYIADAIGFNMGNIAEQYLIGDRVDVVGSLEINDFGDNENIQINLKDIRKTI